MQVGLAGASRKANFAGPTMRGAYTGLGATRTAANRPAGAELGNWSTTYTNSYEVCLFTHIVAFSCCPSCVMHLSTLFDRVCAAVKASMLLASLLRVFLLCNCSIACVMYDLTLLVSCVNSSHDFHCFCIWCKLA